MGANYEIYQIILRDPGGNKQTRKSIGKEPNGDYLSAP